MQAKKTRSETYWIIYNIRLEKGTSIATMDTGYRPVAHAKLGLP